jgi:predicted site-specific integrase-resolvase
MSTNIDKRGRLYYISHMKLSQYAKQQGISYRTALRWFRSGAIAGYQAPSGTIIVQQEKPVSPVAQKVVLYARVSSTEHRANLDRQAERLMAYACARGYQVSQVVKEIGSGVNDTRPKFLALLADSTISRILVEHKDRATRFGFRSIETLLKTAGREIEVVNTAENDTEDLIADLTSIIYSFCARLYGQRSAKRKPEKIVQELEAPDAIG